MQVPIEDIKVKKRIREDDGDLQALADSLRRFGQINPVLLTTNNILVAGGRRLAAAKLLGWHTINAAIVDVPEDMELIEYEIEENFQRQDFNSMEAQKARKSLYRLRNPGFFRRIFRWFVRLFRRLHRAIARSRDW
jgi:ParB family chromosome partitioning protein